MSEPLGSIAPEISAPDVVDSYGVRTIKVLVGCGGALIVGMLLLPFLLLILGGGDPATPDDFRPTPQPPKEAAHSGV